MVMIHVDDLLVVGKRDYVLGNFLKEFKAAYEISVQCIEKPGDELTFLKRLYTLHDDGRLTLQTHEKHITQLCGLLGVTVSLALSLCQYVLRPRRGLGQASPSLEVPRLQAVETRDLFQQQNRKGKSVITKTSRHKGLVLGVRFWYLKLI